MEVNMNKTVLIIASVLLLAGIIAAAVFNFGGVSSKETSASSCSGSCSKTSTCDSGSCQASVTGTCGCGKTSASECPCGCNGSCGGTCGNPDCTCKK